MEMLKECSSMTNVTIVCSDGIIHTHKIVVASASDFIKHLLSDIPVSDEITLYLPDHDKTSVMKLLDGVFTNDTIKHDDNQGSSIDFSSLVSVCEPVLLKVFFSVAKATRIANVRNKNPSASQNRFY